MPLVSLVGHRLLIIFVVGHGALCPVDSGGSLSAGHLGNPSAPALWHLSDFQTPRGIGRCRRLPRWWEAKSQSAPKQSTVPHCARPGRRGHWYTYPSTVSTMVKLDKR